LAEKILTAKPALEGERKQVTVLFADLKGSMELLADRHPEEAQHLLDSVVERMMAAVHRCEGADRPKRSCRAGVLRGISHASVGEAVSGGSRADPRRPLHIRVRLNSGEVVVRSIGSDLHMDYSAVGQTTHMSGLSNLHHRCTCF
jgi:class 3 adenylate cyclase